MNPHIGYDRWEAAVSPDHERAHAYVRTILREPNRVVPSKTEASLYFT